MRVALLADVHANRESLVACLVDVRRLGADRLAFLGDLVGYGADPGWVVDRVREEVARGAVTVRGNHDASVADPAREGRHEEAQRVADWTRAQLDEPSLAFLRGLPLEHEEGDVLCVHANAYAPGRWDYLAGRVEVGRSLAATRASITFCGHVHDPMLWTLSGTVKLGEFRPVADTPIPVPGHRQWLAVVGSAGQPRDGDPAACWALFDSAARTLTWRRVAYDHAGAAARIRAAGLPERFAARLETGC
ncbi:MAG: metallophosphoesterase family protein [Burkholderiaceae bacterium]|nr:metallophosphoesterase [Burkholderiales bacterium]MCZ8337852.1 metallophosphoesterase family protein [Burkholderiaceae bacterium]